MNTSKFWADIFITRTTGRRAVFQVNKPDPREPKERRMKQVYWSGEDKEGYK